MKPFIIVNSLPEPVLLAVQDLKRDLFRLTGEDFKIQSEGSGIVVRIVESDEESYRVSVSDDSVTITGGGTLGAIYGIYAFERRCLGILPICRIADLFPPKHALSLKPQSFSSAPRKTRFRGWFLNDEDLLCECKLGGGKRYIDYPFYESVMDGEVLDLILETALRMEINLMIPGSFVDIDNPAEEELIKACVRRGFYISQHHVEPMGVSFFAAEHYLKSRSLNEIVSFVENPSRMEEIWLYYAEKWAKYGDRVVWQLGLRGKGDSPIWASDPSVAPDEAARGALLTDAIATQHRIISKAMGTSKFFSTATLWMEGAELFGKGHLVLPPNTIAVFSDIGVSQMLGEDFYVTPRKPENKYGIYYHAAYWSEGAHLAEGIDLRKMSDSYQIAAEKDSLYYLILNVSNVRPLHFSIWYSSEWINSCGVHTLEKQLMEIYGDEAKNMIPLYRAYYESIGDMGLNNLKARCRKRGFFRHPVENLPYPEFPAADGALYALGRLTIKNNLAVRYVEFPDLTESLNRFETLSNEIEETIPSLSPDLQIYVKESLGYHTFHLKQLTRWVLCLKENKDNEAAEALKSILEKRKILENGFWENWHRGEKKANILNLLSMTVNRSCEASND